MFIKLKKFGERKVAVQPNLFFFPLVEEKDLLNGVSLVTILYCNRWNCV